MTENKNWKYAQILVEYSQKDTRYFIAEVYSLGPSGEYNTFCQTHLETIEDLKLAINDIERDGPNTWFYDNGRFEWKKSGNTFEWDWHPISENDSLKTAYCEASVDCSVTPYGEQK